MKDRTGQNGTGKRNNAKIQKKQRKGKRSDVHSQQNECWWWASDTRDKCDRNMHTSIYEAQQSDSCKSLRAKQKEIWLGLNWWRDMLAQRSLYRRKRRKRRKRRRSALLSAIITAPTPSKIVTTHPSHTAYVCTKHTEGRPKVAPLWSAVQKLGNPAAFLPLCFSRDALMSSTLFKTLLSFHALACGQRLSGF